MPQLTKWLYKVVTLNAPDDPLANCLNICGADGWRVVPGTVHTSGSQVRVICEKEAD